MIENPSCVTTNIDQFPVNCRTFIKVWKFDIITQISAHGETFYINFYYSIFQFREKRITLRIFVGKNTKLYNNDMKLQHSS